MLALAAFTLATLGWLVWRVGPWTSPRFDEYRMLGGGDMPAALALGPDGAVWFTIDNADTLGVLRDGRMQRIPKGRATMPGPVDPARLLVCELGEGAFDGVSGPIRPDWNAA